MTWLSPFTDLSCQKDNSDPVPMFPQGEIIEEDVIEIPLEPHLIQNPETQMSQFLPWTCKETTVDI